MKHFKRALLLVFGLAFLSALVSEEDSDRPSGATQTRGQTATSIIAPTTLSNDASAPATLIEPDKERALTASPAPGATGPIVYVTGSRVNFRQGPSMNHKVLGQLVEGDKARVVTSNDAGWSRLVRLDGSEAGWMATRFLSATQPVVAPRPPAPSRTVAAPSSAELRAARAAIIQQSLAAYPGNCPCPYNRDAAGRRCGKRSA